MKKISVLNRYYRITKFYEFLKKIAIKCSLTTLIFVCIFLFLNHFFFDIKLILKSLLDNYSSKFILTTFFISETILGLLPPELFIIWSYKMNNSWLYLGLLGILSNLGGICSYCLGSLTFKVPSVKNYIENKISIHIKNINKWGGIFVLVAVMMPFSHAMVSFACGLIKYDFRSYILWAAFRLLGFIIYGVVIFSLI